MSELTAQWHVDVDVSELDEATCDHFADGLGLYFHGLDSLGETTIAHRFIADGSEGAVILRMIRRDSTFAIELTTCGEPVVSDATVTNLRVLAAVAVETIPAAAEIAPDPFEDILIEELELGIRSYNVLKRHGVQTVSDLLSIPESELAAIPELSEKSVDEIARAVRSRGLELGQADEPSAAGQEEVS